MVLSEVATGAPEDHLRGDRAGRRAAHRHEGPGDPRRRQSARRGAERPHRRPSASTCTPGCWPSRWSCCSARRAPSGAIALPGTRLAVARPAAQRVHPARVRRRRSRCGCGCTSAFRRWRPTTQLAALVSEIEDRFGALPEPAQNLVYATSLRLRARGDRRRGDRRGRRRDRGSVRSAASRGSGAAGARRRRAAQARQQPAAHGARAGRRLDGRLYALLEALPGTTARPDPM